MYATNENAAKNHADSNKLAGANGEGRTPKGLSTRQILSLIQHHSKHRETASNQACVSTACSVWCGYSRVSGDISVTIFKFPAAASQSRCSLSGPSPLRVGRRNCCIFCNGSVGKTEGNRDNSPRTDSMRVDIEKTGYAGERGGSLRYYIPFRPFFIRPFGAVHENQRFSPVCIDGALLAGCMWERRGWEVATRQPHKSLLVTKAEVCGEV
jgi:hypothetical protein